MNEDFPLDVQRLLLRLKDGEGSKGFRSCLSTKALVLLYQCNSSRRTMSLCKLALVRMARTITGKASQKTKPWCDVNWGDIVVMTATGRRKATLEKASQDKDSYHKSWHFT